MYSGIYSQLPQYFGDQPGTAVEGEFQLLKQTFDVVQQLLVGLFAVFRFVDAYQFHFGEFVQAVQATYVSVSYTHLDVYKRQNCTAAPGGEAFGALSSC